MKKLDLDSIKCAVFDMDGTILDSMGMWHKIGKIYLESLGLAAGENLWDEIKRLNLAESADYFIEKYDVERSKEQIMQDIKNIIFESYAKKLQLKEGARKILETLNEIGIPCILATATERESVIACMERLDCRKYFRKILTCLEYNTTKSEPLIFEKSAEICGAKAGETLVFEDALHAIRTAKKSGFKVVAVYDESNEERTEPPLTDWERIQSLCDESCMSLKEIEISNS